MTRLALEINDVCLVGATARGVVFEAAGMAWLGDKGASFGADAFAKARLEPDRISSRHWQVLDQTPLARPRGPLQTHADVVFAHLESIWQDHGRDVDQVIMVLPGCYTREQLGLLLGMCGRLAVPVGGFVDAALAATHRSYPGAELVHLETYLHRAVLSHLEQGSRLRRSHVEEFDKAGVAQVRETLIKAVAAEFVREVRFDPLYRASSEQQLYELLAGLDAATQPGGTFEIVLDSPAGSQRVDIAARLLEAALRESVRTLSEFVTGQRFANVPMVVQLSAQAARIPGLEVALRSQGHPVVRLQPGAAACGALALAEQLPSGSAVFLDEAPLPDVAEVPPRDLLAPEVAQSPQPTHLLYLDTAYPLGETPLVIGRESEAGGVDIRLRDPPPGVSRRHCSVAVREGAVVVEDHSTYGTWVNELPVTGRTRLRLGDRIQLGNADVELRLIQVLPGASG